VAAAGDTIFCAEMVDIHRDSLISRLKRFWLEIALTSLETLLPLLKSKEDIMITSKITSKGQITIPKIIREYLNVDVADTIEFTLLEDGKVLITNSSTSAEALFGLLKHRKRKRPVEVSELDAAIKKRRQERLAE
jgi:AbrB family looped-hinge helix DNA binding protein